MSTPKPPETETKAKHNPWDMSYAWFNSAYEMQRQYNQALWDLFSFEQHALQTDLIQELHWMAQCVVMAKDPELLFRYLRRHWQKPANALTEQMLTSNQLLIRVWTLGFLEWQKEFLPHQSEK